MPIAINDALPEAIFQTMTKDGPENVSSSDFFSNRKIVLFAVPGAFTPVCNATHLPGFLEHFETIKSKNVDEIAVVSVNDVWVMNQWAKSSGARGKIVFLADGSADFTREIGLAVDLSSGGMGLRSKRYSMIVENNIVKTLNLEEAPGLAELSGAAAILSQL